MISSIKSPLVPWVYWDFGYKNGTNPIADWHTGLSDDAKNLLHDLLKTNKKTDKPTDWRDLKFLKGTAKEYKIWELRFKANGVQHRLFGIFGPERKQATFLVGCTHKQKIYNPPDCIETAIARSKLVNEKRWVGHERKIRLDI